MSRLDFAAMAKPLRFGTPAGADPAAPKASTGGGS